LGELPVRRVERPGERAALLSQTVRGDGAVFPIQVRSAVKVL
jgi:hypothetical protein